MPLLPHDVLFAANGKQRTVTLIHELPSHSDTITAPFTINPKGKEGYINLRDLFLSMVVGDPTEVEFAEFVFGDIAYWERLANCPAMKDYVREWRRMADMKRKTEAFKSIIREAKESKGASAVTAARYLIEEPWKKDSRDKRVSKRTTEEAFNNINDDLSRLREDGLLQ